MNFQTGHTMLLLMMYPIEGESFLEHGLKIRFQGSHICLYCNNVDYFKFNIKSDVHIKAFLYQLAPEDESLIKNLTK